MKFLPADLQNKVLRLVTDNATGLLTGAGVVGVVGTAVLAGRAVIKAERALEQLDIDWHEEAQQYALDHDGAGMVPPPTQTDKVRATWTYFVPPVAAGSATIAAIVMANRISAGRAAALAAAYGLADGRLKEYQAKVAEKLTGPKNQAIQDEIAQDQVTANPPSGQVVLLGEGLVLCYDSLSGRYFQSTAEKIKKAENSVNHQLFHHQICSLSFLYEELGLKETDLSDSLGWNMVTADNKQLEIKITAVVTDDNKPCLSLGFNNLPKPNYEQLY